MRIRFASPVLLAAMLALPACQMLPEGTESADHQLQCGDQTLGYSLKGDSVRLNLEDGPKTLERRESASGALYRSESGDTRFWSKGERVTVTLAGERLPECHHTGQMNLEAPRWRVVAVKGDSVPKDAAPATLNFMASGRLAGRAGCNHFMAAWERVGERLIIERTATTRMACPSDVMAFEEGFLAALSRVERARMTDAGNLVLLGREGDELIRASAEAEDEQQ